MVLVILNDKMLCIFVSGRHVFMLSAATLVIDIERRSHIRDILCQQCTGIFRRVHKNTFL